MADILCEASEVTMRSIASVPDCRDRGVCDRKEEEKHQDCQEKSAPFLRLNSRAMGMGILLIFRCFHRK
jgi:hypothetical protein